MENVFYLVFSPPLPTGTKVLCKDVQATCGVSANMEQAGSPCVEARSMVSQRCPHPHLSLWMFHYRIKEALQMSLMLGAMIMGR